MVNMQNHPISADDEIAQLKLGNEFLYRKIYKENFQLVLKLVLSNHGDEEDARDIYQETFIVFYEKLKQDDFKLTCAIPTYLYSVARNLWYKRLRKLQYDGVLKLKETMDAEDVEEDVEAHVTREGFMTSIERSLEQLGDPCCSILKDFFYNKLSMDEIALKFGYTNSDNAKNQKYKCFNRFKKLVLVNGRA
ncbi:MAG TPA: sigma-70 family RNA polymerase sigma factor [Flavobacteriales bacterium]|nr:sigma-70 family RNA polymerase sigma factor [Flavobacteriales bacterium]